MTKEILQRAEHFLWLTGRVIDQRRFEYLFGSGDVAARREAARVALRAYETGDGGYGYGLEPDGRGPVSQPPHVMEALRILDELGLGDGEEARRVAGYLESLQVPDGGIPLVLPSIAPYPHAPWWGFEDEPTGSLITTGHLLARLHANGFALPWMERATAFCWTGVDRILETGETHPYEVEGLLRFLDHVPDRDRASTAAERLGKIVRNQRLIVTDPGDLEGVFAYSPGEVHYAYILADHPGSLARAWFSDEEMEANLDALAADQAEDGGFPLRWQRWAPGTELEWRPTLTLLALAILRAYRRLGGVDDRP